MQLARISDPQLSPDGHSVAFTVQTIDVANNTKPKQIYVVTLDGGAPRKIADAVIAMSRVCSSPLGIDPPVVKRQRVWCRGCSTAGA